MDVSCVCCAQQPAVVPHRQLCRCNNACCCVNEISYCCRTSSSGEVVRRCLVAPWPEHHPRTHCSHNETVVPSRRNVSASGDAGHTRLLALRCSRQLFALDATSANFPVHQETHHCPPEGTNSNYGSNRDDHVKSDNSDEQSPWVGFRAPPLSSQTQIVSQHKRVSTTRVGRTSSLCALE